MNSKKVKLRVLSAAMCLAIAMGTAPVGLLVNAADTTTSVTASTNTSDSIKVNNMTINCKISGKSVYITSVSGSDKHLTIPDTLLGKSRITISKDAFQKAKIPNLQEVTFPSTLSKIEEGAFNGCDHIVRLTFGTNSNLKCGINTLSNLKEIRMDSVSPESIPKEAYSNLKSGKTIKKYATSDFQMGYSFSGTGLTQSTTDKIFRTANDSSTFQITATNKKLSTLQYCVQVRAEGSSTYQTKKDWSSVSKQSNGTYKFTYSDKLGIGRNIVRIGVKDTVSGITTYKYYVAIVGFDTQFTYGGNIYQMCDSGKINVKTSTAFKVTPVAKSASYKIEYKKKSSSNYIELNNSSKSLRFNSHVPYDIRVTVTNNGKTMTKTWSVTPQGGKINVNVDKALSGGTIEVYKSGKTTVFETIALTSSESTHTTYLPVGTFEFRAKKAPSGYTANAKGVQVTVKNDGTYTVNASSLFTSGVQNTSTISSQNIDLGSDITLKGKATGGKGPYTYTFAYKKTTSSSWTTINPSKNDSATATVKPAAAVAYQARVIAKDSTGKTSTKTFNFTVNTALENKSTISSTDVKPNTAITLTGKASGGSKSYKYNFYYKSPSDTSWVKIGDGYSSTNKQTFTPNKTGTYKFRINVKDTTGSVIARDFTVTVTAALQNQSSISSASVVPNTKIVMTAKATGGTSPYKYAFYYRRTTTEKWTVAGTEFGTSTTSSFTPSAAGEFIVKIVVKDAKGAEASKTFNVTCSSELTNKSSVDQNKVIPGTTIKLTAKGSGGISPYTYTFSYKGASDSTWKTIDTANTTTTTQSLKLSTVGTYNVKISIKDKSGKTSDKIFTVVCAAELKNNSTVSATNITPGTTVTITGKASGGAGSYKYSFAYKKKSASTWTQIGTEFGTASTATFKPTAADTYNVRIIVKDKNNTTVTKTFEVVSASTLQNTSSISASSVKPNQTVTLTAKASGGSGKYTYSFAYKKSSASTWTTINASSSNTSTATFKPTTAGTYNARVIVTDSNGQSLAKVFDVICASELTNSSSVSATNVKAGSSITITGKASGGTAPYTYSYAYRKTSETQWTRIGSSEYTSSTSATFKPSAVGSYQVQVIVKDKNGAVTGKIMNVSAVKETAATFSVKLQTTTNKAVANATLMLKNTATDEGVEATTNSSGVASFNAPKGSYQLYLNLPTGYSTNNYVHDVTIGDGNQTMTLTVNEKLANHGTIQVTIKLQNGTPCNKFPVVITNASTGTTYATKTPNSSGIAEFTDVPYGNYKISLKNLPEGYKLDSYALELKSDMASVGFPLQNTILSSVGTINLQASVDAKGAEFSAYKDGKLVKTGTIQSNGVCKLELEAGTYDIKCTKIPTGFNQKYVGFTIEGCKVIVGQSYQYNVAQLFVRV